ncbi:bacteriophage lambda minor tail family protein [Escherichia coli 3-373-03_S4_C3]|nr:bacteriophage lambda minor tail family protein [Escherichia coli 3-373-03_S4_C3]
MFLKTESFEHNGVTVTLSELSALQRIEHLAWLKEQEKKAESRQQPEVYCGGSYQRRGVSGGDVPVA